MSYLIIVLLFVIFTGEIAGIDPPVKGFVLCPSLLLSSTSLNNTIMRKTGNYKHGLTGSKLYVLWERIKNRCYNPDTEMYHVYGGKGIKMYKDWINDPVAFVEYCKTLDGCNNPSLSIDRIKSDEDYQPGNLRFSTSQIQARNQGLRSTNKTGYAGVHKRGKTYTATIGIDYLIHYIGVFQTVSDAAKARDQYIIDNNLEGFNLQVL